MWLRLASPKMPASEYVKPKVSTCNYLLIMRKTYRAEIKTEVKIEKDCCTINSWGNTANRPDFTETGSIREIRNALLQRSKKHCTMAEKLQPNVQIRPWKSPLHSADILSLSCKLAFSPAHCL